MPDAPRRRGGGRAAAARPPAASPASDEAADAESAALTSGQSAPHEGRPRPGSSRALSDGRVQMLVYLPPALVKAVKRIALEQDTSASYVVEQALGDWLTREAEPARRRTATRPAPVPPIPSGGRDNPQSERP